MKTLIDEVLRCVKKTHNEDSIIKLQNVLADTVDSVSKHFKTNEKMNRDEFEIICNKAWDSRLGQNPIVKPTQKDNNEVDD